MRCSSADSEVNQNKDCCNGKSEIFNDLNEQINSGTLFVEDKLPDGLEFTGFVTTDDGSIGAVKRSDGTLCTGKVIDDTNEARTDSVWWNRRLNGSFFLCGGSINLSSMYS